MQVRASEAKGMIEDGKTEFIIPANIEGTMTRVRLYDKNRVRYMKPTSALIARERPLVVVDTDSEVTGGPRNSFASIASVTLTEVSEEITSSDYVSTLYNPKDSL